MVVRRILLTQSSLFPHFGFRQRGLGMIQLLSRASCLWRRLKGHCHDDFAVLGQFCAEIITLKLY